MSIRLSQRRKPLVKKLYLSTLNPEIKFSNRINKSPSLNQLRVILISPPRYGATVTAVGGGILGVAVYTEWWYIESGVILRVAV